MSHLREHDTPSDDPTDMDTERLVVLIDRTIATLAAKRIAPDDLQPLYEVRDTLKLLSRKAPPVTEERRQGRTVASESVLARACATMESLVLGGQSWEQAAQTIARQLLASGLQLPEKGGDARGWRRVLEAHKSFSRGQASAEALDEFHRFKRQIGEIPAQERLSYILSGRPWDRRNSRTDRRAS